MSDSQIVSEFVIANILVKRSFPEGDSRCVPEAEYVLGDEEAEVKEYKHPYCWRDIPQFSKQFLQSLQKEIEGYTPYDKCVERANILLLGNSLSGKSSFINGISSFFKGRLCSRIPISYSGKKRANKVSTYDVKGSTQTLNLNIFEFHEVALHSFNFHMLTDVLCGKFCSRSIKVSDQKHSDRKNSDISEWLSQRIHSVGLVIRASEFGDMTNDVKQGFRQVYKFLVSRDYRPIILLTHIDHLVNVSTDWVPETFCSTTMKETVDEVSRMFSVPRNSIILVKNYESECELRIDMNVLLLQALQRLLHTANDYMETCCDRIQIEGYGETEV